MILDIFSKYSAGGPEVSGAPDNRLPLTNGKSGPAQGRLI